MAFASIYNMPSHDITATLPVVMVTPEHVQANPALFQFRHSAANPSGIKATDRFKGAWNSEKHGDPLLLYEDKHNQLFVVDGHHRLEFAKRLNERFFGNAPKTLKAQILREAEGVTPEQAKIIGAYRNLKEIGIQEPVIGEKLVEAAEVLHDAMKHPELAQVLPELPATTVLHQSAMAASLDDASFEIASKKLPESIAVPIAAFAAAQPMPDATRVEVLRVVANALAPLKVPCLH
jgi:hypothetical protein